jgi:hypothetical protein
MQREPSARAACRRVVGLEGCRSLELVLMPVADYGRLDDVPALQSL